MIFNSLTYLLFLSVVVVAYWVLPLRGRQWLLFAASICFYGFWRFDYAAVMMVSALTDYLVSLRLGVTNEPRRRKRLLALSLVVNLGLLFYFKYLTFALDNAAGLAGLLGVSWTPMLEILLPLGISFYTFQTISYTVDVYRRRIEPLHDFVVYACYVTFFPQLVAGPILRASEVVTQLMTQQRLRLDDLVIGIRRVLFGLLLKVGLADQIAGLVNTGFDSDPALLSALDVWTLAFLFGFQIYFDFAGYSHIALGSARLMGIVFPENFWHPYLATSPREFWKRWHISLSSWIRDYLYLPLVGASQRAHGSSGGLGEVERDGRTLALFTTWAVMGLWHGAAWTFLLWGLYHAGVVFLHRWTSRRLPDLGRWGAVMGWAVTLPIMMLGWVPFRATSLAQTFTMWGHTLDPRRYTFLSLRENTHLVTGLVLLLVVGAGLLRPRLTTPRFALRPVAWWPAQTLAYAVLAAVVFVFLRPIEQFIYFQF